MQLPIKNLHALPRERPGCKRKSSFFFKLAKESPVAGGPDKRYETYS